MHIPAARINATKKQAGDGDEIALLSQPVLNPLGDADMGSLEEEVLQKLSASHLAGAADAYRQNSRIEKNRIDRKESATISMTRDSLLVLPARPFQQQ